MALLSEVGTFTSTAGPQDVALSTFAGEIPKVVLIWHAGSTADGVAAGGKLGFGIGVSASSRAAVAVASEDAQAASDADRRHTNASAVTLMDYAQAVIEAGNIAMAADKFTITYSTSLTGVIYNYMALGGDDLTDVYVDEITSPASAQSVAYTSVGFQPTSLIAFTAGNSTAPANTTTDSLIGLGLHDGTDSATSHMYSQTAVGTSNTTRYQVAKFLSVVGATVLDECVVTSLDADGYTLNWTTADATARYAWVLCLKGPQVKVLTGDQPATDTTATRTISFAPKAALAITHMGPGTGFSDDVPSAVGSGQSFKHDGENDTLKITAGNVSFSVTDAVSFSMWIKTKGSGTQIALGRPGGAGVWLGTAGGVYRFNIWTGANKTVNSSATTASNVWRHIVGAWDQNEGNMYLYVDGAVDGSLAMTDAISGMSGAYYIGGPTASFVRGLIDDVRVYNKQLSSDEVTYLYSNGASGTDPTTTNLQGHWKLDGSLLDETANNYDLIQSGQVNDNARIGIGGWDASNNMAFAGAVDEDNQTTTDADRIQDSNEAIKHLDHAQTVVGSASFAASGTDLIETWTNTDGTQREHALLVFGDAASGSSNCTHPLSQSLVYPLVESLAKPLTM